MPIQKPEYQLTFDLDLPEVEETALSADEVRLRSETARAAFDDKADLKWFAEYAKLREGGWHWRLAAYIAWAASPRVSRMPKTQDELAIQYLGLTSDRAIATWRKKNPAIDEMVATLQAAPLWDHRADVFAALVDNAKEADYKTHNDRKLFLELTGDYVPTAKLAAMLAKGNIAKEDLNQYSDEELAAMYRQLVNDIKPKTETDNEEE